MNYVFVVLASCSLAYFFPQYKITHITIFFSKLFDTLLSRVSKTDSENKSNILFSLIVPFLLCVFSCGIPSVCFFFLSQVSPVLLFPIEVFFAYHLISIPLMETFLQKGTKSVLTNSNTIIQSIVYYVDNFFIPCFAIALLGLPFACLCRAVSYCVKSTVQLDSKCNSIRKMHDVLYFIPSYLITLVLFVSSLAFPFCHVRNAYDTFLIDRKKVEPHWLSRILSACFGLLCIQIPVSFEKEGVVVTEYIGSTKSAISSEDVKRIVYLLYCSGILTLFLLLLMRLILTWGVW